MAVHIIIDGYNLIRRSPEMSSLDRQALELGREALVEQLAVYKRIKRHKITIVFDGSEQYSFFETKGQEKGIQIRFSRQGESADTLIMRMAEMEKQKALVVSSDHAVSDFCASRGAAVIGADAFLQKMEMAALIDLKGGAIEDGPEEGWALTTRKKGPSKRPSKSKRKNWKKLQKL